jgi:hypothetical protein
MNSEKWKATDMANLMGDDRRFTKSASGPEAECGKCAFFWAAKDGGIGECRRYAPHPNLAGDPEKAPVDFVVWPIVQAFTFCGEFKDRHGWAHARRPVEAAAAE